MTDDPSQRTDTTEPLAIDGGRPAAQEVIPYGRQWIDDDDIAAVTQVLRSDWLTTGPEVDRFEEALGRVMGAKHVVAVSNGTTALHAAVAAAGIGPGDQVIVPAMTFVATANAVCLAGAEPVIADIDPDTLLIEPQDVARRITPKTRAIIGVDFAGQPCHNEALQGLATEHGLTYIVDAAHSLGAHDGAQAVGSIADMTTFSFHPVKHITTAEGGAVSTDDDALAAHLRRFRNHGIATDHRQRQARGTHAYDMVELGHNLRISDMQCALGTSQLKHLETWVERRRTIAARYDEAFEGLPLQPLATRAGVRHAYHLYVIKLQLDALTHDRDDVFHALRAEGLAVNVHYRPVHHHTYHRQRQSATNAPLAVADAVYPRLLSLPMYPAMTPQDVETVISAMRKVLTAYQR